MVGSVGVILEIAGIRIKTHTEPVVSDADIETSKGIA